MHKLAVYYSANSVHYAQNLEVDRQGIRGFFEIIKTIVQLHEVIFRAETALKIT